MGTIFKNDRKKVLRNERFIFLLKNYNNFVSSLSKTIFQNDCFILRFFLIVNEKKWTFFKKVKAVPSLGEYPHPGGTYLLPWDFSLFEKWALMEFKK